MPCKTSAFEDYICPIGSRNDEAESPVLPVGSFESLVQNYSNTMSEGGLRGSIEEDTAFFRRLVDTVPAMYYFDSDTKLQLKEQRNKHMDEKVQEIEKGLKRSLDWTGKAKMKRARYDPQENQTVSQLQGQMESVTVSEPKSKKKMTQMNEEEELEVDELKSSTNNLEDLRMKLQEKIKALSAKRKDRGSHDKRQLKKLKRQQSKMKMKLKQKMQKNTEHIPNKTETTDSVPESTPAKPVFNKEGKIVFSKFDFSDIGDGGSKNKNAPKGKDFKKLLKKAQKEKEDVANLEETDADKAKSLKEKQKWEKAIQKAEGAKIRDNPELLKKAIKRKDKRKEKSAKAWDERNKNVEEKMKSRQDKRKRNIKKKKDSTVNRKITKAKKKGRVVPGF